MRILLGVFALLCAFSTSSLYAYVPADFLRRRDGGTFPYRIFVPRDQIAGQKYPLVVFLHGVGESGTDNNKQIGDGAGTDNGMLNFVTNANQEVRKCFVLAPQHPSGWWGNIQATTIFHGILDEALAEFPSIDPDRIYVTGLSAGGYSTVRNVLHAPSRIAAAAPLSMAGIESGDWDRLATMNQVPFWVMCATNDSFINQCERIADRLRAEGGRPFFTAYASGGHSSSVWRAAYQDERFLHWLFAQRRGQPMQAPPFQPTITSPTTADTFSTNTNSMNFAGTVSLAVGIGAVARTDWYNSRNYVFPTLPKTQATGTSAWSATVPLLAGNQRIGLIATVPVWAGTLGGTVQGSALLNVANNTPNQAPTVDAGSDFAVTLPASANLGGLVSDDGLPTVAGLSSIWTKVSGPGTVTFGTANIPSTTANFSAPGNYVLRLTATDTVLTSSDEVSVSVLPSGSTSARWLVDFGESSRTTPGQGWNNVIAYAGGTALNSLRDTSGLTTSVHLQLLDSFSNIFASTALTPVVYTTSATQDNFYIQNASVRVNLSGLIAGARYEFRLFATRPAPPADGANRITVYTAGSQSSGDYNAVDNTDRIAAIRGVAADSNGVIELRVQPKGGSGYGYLGVLDLSLQPTQSYDAWRTARFGSAANDETIAGQQADPDKDGAANLLEFALGQDPLTAQTQPLQAASAGGRLQLIFQTQHISSFRYSVEASSDMATWTAIAERYPLQTAWVGPATVTSQGSGDFRTTIVQDNEPMANHSRRFMRLRIYP